MYEKIVQLKFEAADGKKYATDCAETSNPLRIIQSIPSPKAEPFKQWLAQVSYERVAGKAREATEKELGRSVVTSKNFLPNKDKSNQIDQK